MDRAKMFYALLGLLMILVGLWYAEIFPDPYHQGSNVNVYVWIQREIDELLHGEKG